MARPVGRPKAAPKPRELLTNIIPIKDMFDDDEIVIYHSLIDIYLKDFDEDDLTSSDIDDIMTLVTNKIIEIRLMKQSKDDADSHLNYSNSMEKLRKQSDKIKDNLASRRKDRIDPNEFKGFSIVDLAVAFDDSKKAKLEKKARDMKASQNELLDSLEANSSKDDID
jgi:hypothetical protein